MMNSQQPDDDTEITIRDFAIFTAYIVGIVIIFFFMSRASRTEYKYDTAHQVYHAGDCK